MKSLKDKALFVAEVAVAIAAIALFQTKVMQLPVVGKFLPGAKASS